MNKVNWMHALTILIAVAVLYILWKPLLFLGMAWGLLGAVWGGRTNKKELVGEGLTTFAVCLLLFLIF